MFAVVAACSVERPCRWELEYGIEDWGSFEHAVEALKAMSNMKGRYAAAAKTLGVDAEDDPADIKRVYR